MARPLQGLHRSHAAADDSKQPIESEAVDEQLLRPDHVAHHEHRKGEVVGFAGARV
jgi:hypothetical protein